MRLLQQKLGYVKLHYFGAGDERPIISGKSSQRVGPVEHFVKAHLDPSP